MTLQEYVNQQIKKKHLEQAFKLLGDLQEQIELFTDNVYVGCKKCHREFKTTKLFMKHKCKF